YNNGRDGILSTASSGKIYNNTVYHNGQAGFQNLSDSSNNATNNIFYLNGTAAISGSTSGSQNLTTNPSFVNAAAGDFHLQAGSPAIDAGMTVSEVTTDRDKMPRPQGARFDIGAYEYTGSAPRPLSAPTNFRIAGR